MEEEVTTVTAVRSLHRLLTNAPQKQKTHDCKTVGFHYYLKDNRKLPVVAFNVIAPVSKSFFVHALHELLRAW